ncbi:MAG: ABC transporter ATP-binding protein [Proteobacteria bacterium]|nr:ABC transporter ATP-binding protein [Pseudomonadota bacterium]
MFKIENLEISLIKKNKIDKVLIKNISLRIPNGSIVCLVGESGSGKTLTGYSLMRIQPSQNLKITKGKIFFDNINLLELPEEKMRDLRGKEIFMIPQEPLTALNPVLTIETQLTEIFEFHTNMTKNEIKKECLRLLELVKIDNPSTRLKSYPHQLSGGQRQRVLIAMAIALKPSLIIADEPTTALDVTIQGEILELFLELRERLNLSILLITHDFGILKSISDYVYVMYGGKIVEEGTKEEIFSKPIHPYTKGLIDAVPTIDSTPKTPLKTIPGYAQISDFYCPFYERCNSAQSDCKSEFDYIFINQKHGVLCRKIMK